MTDEPKQPDDAKIKAFADGELDEAESIEMLERMADDPQQARAAAHQRQLKQAVARGMGGLEAPDALRRRIDQLAADTPAAVTAGRIGFVHRWAPALAAAILLAVGVGVFYSAMQTAPSTRGALLTETQLSRFANRHEVCANAPETLHGRGMPAEPARVPDAAAAHLRAPSAALPRLDLAALGYTFVAAGECGVPGKPSVHIVYRATNNPDAPTLSLWIRPDDGRFDIPENAIYRVTPLTAEHPVAVWRAGGLLHYLVGDRGNNVDQLAGAIATH